MAGLLDNLNDPRVRGLLGLGTQMMAAGGPSRLPVSFGQAMGQGMAGGVQAMDQAQQAQMQRGLFERQKAKAEQARLQAAARQRLLADVSIPATTRAYLAAGFPPPKPPKPPADFSLSPGQMRYDPKGKTIAHLPATPPVPSLSTVQKNAAAMGLEPGTEEYNAYVMRVTTRPPEAPAGFSLSPGQMRYDPEGKTIAHLPAAPLAPPKPATDIGKARADFRNGFMTADELEKRVLSAKAPDDKTFERANTLRDEFIQQSKDFVKVRDAYGRIVTSGDDPSPAGDLALIFNYMKVLDPGSVVRESEFKTAAASGALGERMKAAFGRVASGERLSAAMRADFVDRGKRLYVKQAEHHQMLRQQYEGLAGRADVKPKDVLVDYRPPGGAESPSAPPPAPPPVSAGATPSAPLAGRIPKMTTGEIGALDVTELSAEEREAVSRRLKELGF